MACRFLYNNFEVFLFYFLCSQRTGHVRVLSFKLAIAILCQGPLEEKYRCKFLLLTYCAHAHRALEPKPLSSNCRNNIQNSWKSRNIRESPLDHYGDLCELQQHLLDLLDLVQDLVVEGTSRRIVTSTHTLRICSFLD